MIKKALRVFKDWVNKLTETINQKKVEKAYKKEYTTLTPDDNISNGDGYLKALKWAIRGKKAKNIALSGPYGSGKSSVIDTFLRKNWSVKRKSLKISMATFVEEVEGKNGDCMTQRIALKDGEIEKGILKQLFYKVNHKRIPLSRYRKILRIINKKIYSRRFTTDCFSDYFNEMAKKSHLGLNDYMEYETERASVEELKMQNSYFINALYKNAGSN